MMEIIVTARRLRSDYLKKAICDYCTEYLKGILSDEQLQMFERIFYEAVDGLLISDTR